MNLRTNIPAVNAHRSLGNVARSQRTAAARLSSGFRINSAADDAAGLAISQQKRAQIRSLDQAYTNAQDGVALIRTAEGGIATINEMLIRMRELVVQAANDTYVHQLCPGGYEKENGEICPGGYVVNSQRELIQAEIDQLIEEIDALSQRVQFNTRNLLGGNYARDAFILPPAVQLADEILSVMSPIEPLNAPPTPTRIIDAALLAAYTICPNGTFEVDVAGTLILNGGQIFEIVGDQLPIARIRVESGETATVILNNVNIETDIGAALDTRYATVDLWLTGVNTFTTIASPRAAIETTGGSLTIDGPGYLLAESNGFGGAGIGGGEQESGGDIIINGGNVTAFANTGAGIGNGAGVAGDGGTITINGGEVVASAAGWNSGNSRFGGAGIGGGMSNRSDAIVINGGNIWASATFGGAGIGGGYNGDGGTITITGGIIFADGNYGAGIGGGQTGDGGTITVTGGAIQAESAQAAAVGGGAIMIGMQSRPPGEGADLTITGGVLQTGGRIGAGSAIHDEHGTTTYLNGNLSAFDIPGGVFDGAGNPLPYVINVEFEDTLPPHDPVGFYLFTNNNYRRFDALTNNTGDVFVWLNEQQVDPPVFAPPPIDNAPPQRIPPTPTGPLWLQTGPNAGQGMNLYIEATDALTLGLVDIAGSPAINVMLEYGVEISPLLTVLDAALQHTTTIRADLGAAQNRLEFTSQSLQITSESISATESRLRDADMAREKMRFTQAQVLQQAGISILAQANQLPTMVLQLLHQ